LDSPALLGGAWQLLHPSEFSEPGHTDFRNSLYSGDAVGKVGVIGLLGRDARPVQAGCV
jgi:hypothetical protein